MHSQIKLGRIAGIEIGLHYSWFLIAFLIAFSLADHFRHATPHWSSTAAWAAAAVTSVLFFVTLLLHELAHSLVAKSYGLRVRAITLFALGGVSQIESDATSAKMEFWIAIVGPLTSLVIGAALLAVAYASGWHSGAESASIGIAILLWLGYINILLAVFNMIPGFPLDGGRVLRAILWGMNGSAERATRWASQIGQAIAFLFILYGLYRFFFGANLGGLWIAFIGWFLLDAARSSHLQSGILTELRGRTVADLTERNCPTVPGYLNLRDFVDEYLLHNAHRLFLVLQGDRVAGLVTSDEIRNVPKEEWTQTSVQAVMRPLDQVRSVPPQMPAVEALELMARANLPFLTVLVNGNLQGIFSQAHVLRYLQLISSTSGASHHREAA
ncbi:MAG TPA: site-2 protease family protein [Terracidiphilus sp.]|nr:site-2 protease family protein [Terracidiphilus sp.]